ncbi:hypothetical protein [Limisphaera sp. VF-2]|uniref:hypothetical protein n=1 Tax=Limisphaera sp. VF-2 TaxID=3400418 RepID=UPI003C1B3BDD
MRLTKTSRVAASVLPACGVGLGGVYLAIRVFPSYSWALFVGTPFLVSFVAALLHGWTGPTTWRAAYGIALLSILLLGALIVCFALDGLICVLMALPMAVLVAFPGSAVGYLVGKRLGRGTACAAAVLVMGAAPGLVAFESHRPATPRLHEVTTRVEVRAPIQSVWDEVIAFDKIDEPPKGWFRLGIAYPVEARIEGDGPGALRYCVFSTGAFLERITRWEAPVALEFDVISNPPPLQELSPWGRIEAPHAAGAFSAERGVFRLCEANGETVLEGTTWYRQNMSPGLYWRNISDLVIHAIHRRVLEQIKKRAEEKYGRHEQ